MFEGITAETTNAIQQLGYVTFAATVLLAFIISIAGFILRWVLKRFERLLDDNKGYIGSMIHSYKELSENTLKNYKELAVKFSDTINEIKDGYQKDLELRDKRFYEAESSRTMMNNTVNRRIDSLGNKIEKINQTLNKK